jgi:hypothetical protein
VFLLLAAANRKDTWIQIGVGGKISFENLLAAINWVVSYNEISLLDVYPQLTISATNN